MSKGYGNSRVVKSARAGEYPFAWGKPGYGPGEFRLPHSVTGDSDRIWIVTMKGPGHWLDAAKNGDIYIGSHPGWAE